MSTRCQIRIVKNGYPLNYYHHCDGYYAGVGKELQGWLHKMLDRNGGVDNDDLDEGVLLTHIANDREYEPTFYLHGDIEYFYLIDLDRHVYRAFHVGAYKPWPSPGDDSYDQYQPRYNQMPFCDECMDLMKGDMEG